MDMMYKSYFKMHVYGEVAFLLPIILCGVRLFVERQIAKCTLRFFQYIDKHFAEMWHDVIL